MNTAMKEVDGVVHLAALWLLQCYEYPRAAFDVNIRGTYNVIEACVANNIERLVIDSLSAIRFSTENFAQTDKEVNRFVRNLKKLGCTTILISEMTNPNSYTPEQFAAHGVIFLHHYLDENTKLMSRAIQVVKMRGTSHDSNMKKLFFTSDGLNVEDI